MTTEAIEVRTDARSLARAAAQSLADALLLASAPREPGLRERHRRCLAQAIERASRALAAAEEEQGRDDVEASATIAGALATLAKAHAALAEDALHGAGQLSLSAQRAPTLEACDDGWRRVVAIVHTAEASAAAAATAAARLEGHAPRSAARAALTALSKADAAARAARRLLDERNHAYTFHTDFGFSFGEGWYIAAAALLAGVMIQIEPAKPATSQADYFLREAGLGGQLQAYRARPRALKQTTEIVARAFRADPVAAQRRLRAAFLGEAPIPQPVIDWTDRALTGAREGKKVLLWIRHGAHHAHRNTTPAELAELARRARLAGLVPLLIGDAVREGEFPEGAADLTLFWKDPIFRGVDGRRAQLQLFEHLARAHGVVGQLGVTTAGMDGPALMGLPTLYLTETSNVRMREWVDSVPGYREVVRDADYLERVEEVLRGWSSR